MDAVILDYLLPGMHGEEAARRIRKARPNIPIILSSGGFSAPDRVLASANAFVSKGEGPEALIEALEEQLQLVPDVRPHPAEPARFSQIGGVTALKGNKLWAAGLAVDARGGLRQADVSNGV